MTELRQGDILANIYLPRFSIKDVNFLHTMKEDGTWCFSDQAILSTTKHRFVAVISQCCEFNQGKRNSFSLAELVGLREWLAPARKVFGLNLAEIVPWKKSDWTKRAAEELLEANSIDRDQDKVELVNVYYLQDDGNHFKEPHLINFTRVSSIGMKEMDRLLKNKVLQLDEAHRIELQQKLAYFYARPAN